MFLAPFDLFTFGRKLILDSRKGVLSDPTRPILTDTVRQSFGSSRRFVQGERLIAGQSGPQTSCLSTGGTIEEENTIPMPSERAADRTTSREIVWLAFQPPPSGHTSKVETGLTKGDFLAPIHCGKSRKTLHTVLPLDIEGSLSPFLGQRSDRKFEGLRCALGCVEDAAEPKERHTREQVSSRRYPLLK
jgi:hypothetical protein